MTSVFVISVTKYMKETTEGSDSYFGSQVHASGKARPLQCLACGPKSL